MGQQKAPPTPEQLAKWAKDALYVADMAYDAGPGVCYLLCKKSRLEIGHTVIAVQSQQQASMAITFIQVAQAVRDAAARVAAGIQS